MNASDARPPYCATCGRDLFPAATEQDGRALAEAEARLRQQARADAAEAREAKLAEREVVLEAFKRENERMLGRVAAAERERDEARAEIEALKDERALARMDAEIDGDAEANALLERASNVLLAAYRLLMHDEDAPNIGAEINSTLDAIRAHRDRVRR